ncbi:hypothetical protein V1264_007787 [Littorina saxatilis]|uniref:Uncharacterized protein n=2 Tax=Littorina saxatilis TaxID=31220 RepID=A0AAN9AW38_9CAEN
MLLARGANPSCREQDEMQRTPLHYATENGYVDVVKQLLSKGAQPDVRDNDGKMPVQYAVSPKTEYDDIAALLLLSMDNKTVRGVFTVPNDSPIDSKAEISLHDLIRRNMKQTVLSVLSCMMDPLGDSSSVRVHYHALDADEEGRDPKHKHFNKDSRSCLHLMSKGQHTDFVYHDVVRLLLKRKWVEYARSCFL